MFVILGASGNVGKKVAESLLARGKKVRAIGRDVNRLSDLTSQGAQAVAGSVEDKTLLKDALQGAEGAFVMIPPITSTQDLYATMDQIGETIATAVAESKVGLIVNLSSAGAEHESKTGPIAGLGRQEKRLNRLTDSRILHLRPTYYMENFFMNISMIQTMDIIGGAIRGDLPLACISTKDVADVAAHQLIDPAFTNKSTRLLLGPRDLTFQEITKVLGRAINKPDLAYVQFSYEDAEKGMIDAGISPSVASAYIEMERAINDGLVSRYPRTSESTTPTTIEEFAQVFAAAYNA